MKNFDWAAGRQLAPASIAVCSALICLARISGAQTPQTNVAVTVRHAPNLNGGTIEGSLQQINGESVALNGGFAMTGDLLVSGLPTLVTNGNPTLAAVVLGTGSASPSGYLVTFNGNCSLEYLRTRTTPVSLPGVAAPPAPAGTRSVSINSPGESFGDPATLRNLTLNGNAGFVAVPPGTYGDFKVSSGSGLVLGVASSVQAVRYNLQNLTCIGNSTVKVVGPVVLTVANGFTGNGTIGASNNPAWLDLRVANGDLTLNGSCTVHGLISVPSGAVIADGNSTLIGACASDQFTLNGGGLVKWSVTSAPVTEPPVVTNQNITLAENRAANITLMGSDPQGRPLIFSMVTRPDHGDLSGTPPSLIYLPSTNFFGSDVFTFKANNGVTDSAPGTISLTVTQVFYAPLAHGQLLTNFEDTTLPITLTASDPQGFTLDYTVLTRPNHGALSGAAPNLLYHPDNNYFGDDSFTFLVSNGLTNSTPATISITNQPVDDPPLVVAGPDQLIILPTTSVTLNGAVQYDDFPGTVDTVLWMKVSGPGSVTFSSPSNTTTDASFSTNGAYRLRLYASDNFLSSSNELAITVDAPPTVAAGPTMTNTFPGVVNLAGWANDDGLPTNAPLSVRWSQISGPGVVVFVDLSATNTAVSFATNGTYVLRLTADDTIGTNFSELTVIENLPPVVNAGENVLTNGLQASVNGSAVDDGLPGPGLTFQWSQSSGPGVITFGNPQQTNTLITASQSGTFVLTLTAFDGAATNSDEVVISFNLPPVVDAGPTQTVNFGTLVTLAATVTDDQLPNNTLTNFWTQIGGLGHATFADPTATNSTVTFDQPGTYVLRLTASDTFATASNDVVIQVNTTPNASPLVTITAPPDGSEFLLGQTIPIQVNASDADGQVTNVNILVDNSVLAQLISPPFTFDWTNGPLGAHDLGFFKCINLNHRS